MQKRTQKNTKKNTVPISEKRHVWKCFKYCILIEAGLSVSNLESILVSKLNFIYLYT